MPPCPQEPCAASTTDVPPCHDGSLSCSFGTLSKAARRQNRAKRSVIKSMGLDDTLLQPPGLDLPSTLSLVDLARRIERIEVLPFKIPIEGFDKLDSCINMLMAASEKFPSAACLDAELPSNCEMFDLTDAPDANLHAEMELLKVKLESSVADISSLLERVGHLEQRSTQLASEIVGPLTDIINDRMDRCRQQYSQHDAAIQTLTDETNKLDDKLHRCLDMIGTCMETFKKGGKKK